LRFALKRSTSARIGPPDWDLDVPRQRHCKIAHLPILRCRATRHLGPSTVPIRAMDQGLDSDWDPVVARKHRSRHHPSRGVGRCRLRLKSTRNVIACEDLPRHRRRRGQVSSRL
jgi:hypothetical protein